MTTVCYRSGVMAADSRAYQQTESSGTVYFPCEKLYRKCGAIIGVAGETEPALVFLDWYGTNKPAPQVLIDGDADFTALVYSKKGLFEYGKYCRAERVLGRFYAIGSGRKAALGAMHMGASARKAVEVACRIDPYSGPPIVTMRL